MIHPSLALLLALCSPANIGGAVRPWILKLERMRRWAAERAAIKAEVKRAKETVDLIGITLVETSCCARHSVKPDHSPRSQVRAARST